MTRERKINILVIILGTALASAGFYFGRADETETVSTQCRSMRIVTEAVGAVIAHADGAGIRSARLNRDRDA